MTPVSIADVPNTAQRLWKAAQEHGWTVRATTATGTPIDAMGRPQRVVKRVPTGEMTDAGRPRIEIVTTDEPLVVSSVAVRFARGDVRLVGLWTDGSYDTGLRDKPFRRLNARELIAAIKQERTP